ncbi:MAG TPA: TolC family protein [Bryobacteraceae bacterium]|nr:TolC family protein [Bryobacteraceae bacterium]
MRLIDSRVICGALAAACLAHGAESLTWQQVRQKFEAANPTLLAGQLGLQESKTLEVTAYLRPNPSVTLGGDQVDFVNSNPLRPLQYFFPYASFSYLHERDNKRELRLDSAKKATGIAESQQQDLERTMLFSLRQAFVQTLEAKAVLDMARENLAYFDREIAISRNQYQAGDIARVDLDRLELQRVQYESDFESATVNLRSAKIQILAMLNDRTPIDSFDVAGPFEFSDAVSPLDTYRQAAMDARPDLKAAAQAISKAETDHQLAVANGSTDPTFGIDFGRNPPISGYVGLNVNIPLRIFDRNQGEKARTEIDIKHAESMRDATQAQVFSDVDSAWVALVSAVNLLKPYKGEDGYLQRSTRVRDDISYSYQHGGSSLVDFLDSQRDYRAVQTAYLNLVGAYLTAAAQLNLAVGHEIIP